MACKITGLVDESVVTLDGNSTVEEAAKEMVAGDTGSMVVLDSGQVAGFFTERDLLKRVIAKELNPSEVKLKDVTTRNLVTIEHDSSCAKALQLMHDHNCRHLLVFDGEDFVGVLSIRDLAHVVGEKHATHEIFVTVMGALILIFTIGVLGVLVFQIPKIIEIAQRVF